MKETKSVSEYSVCSTGIMEGNAQWFYELFGWHWVKTSCHENRYVEKKTYLVAESSDRLRVEDRYVSTRGGYDVTHTLERETDDPKYEKYCELERRVGAYDMWGDGYPRMLKKLKSVFSKARPDTYSQYKKRFKKFYVIGAVLLFFAAVFVAAGPEYWEQAPDPKLVMPCFLFSIALFACPGAVCIIRGIAGHMKSLNKNKLNEEYRTYLTGWLSGQSIDDRNLCTIVKEALEMQIE